MKVILYMAMSLNGMVARENNEEDFISDENWKTFVSLVEKAGCLVWGRKTLEIVSTWDKSYLSDLNGFKKIVVSRQKLNLNSEYQQAISPKEAIKILEKDGFSEAILCGGSLLNSSFAKENLIDEIVLNVEPTVIGKGIPVFSLENFDLNLKLKEINKISEEIIQLRYIVNK